MDRHSLMALSLIAAAAASSPFPSLAIPKRQDDTTAPKPKGQTFADIKPSSEIKWVDCYTDNWKCTYLTVPLNYANASAGTTDVAFAKYLLSEDAEDLLFNPGGPGDGGVDLIMGKDFSGEQGETWAKQWGMNFVTFDPRGTGWTAPKLSCQSSNTTAQSTLGRRTTPDEAKAVFDQKIQANLACNEANKHTDAKYVGTSAVVQDMIHFVELQAAAKGKKPEEAMINYYGVSYGTVIGQTLAQMYPNRLRRVLLDANVNGVTHYQGWAPNSLDDFAHSFWMMSKFCFEAGPEVCALANGMNSIKEVQYRFDRMMTQIENEPFNICGQPLERETYLGLIRLPMYTPRRSYNLIMNLTIALEARDEALIKQSPLIASSGILAACQPTETDTPIPATPASDTSALQIITSVDIAGRYPWKSFEDWKAAAERIVAPYAGLNYALSNGLAGYGMDSFVPPPSQFVEEFKFVNTSVPVLFVNTAGDPVTPMSSVHTISELFGGSSWFIQNSPGHSFTQSKSKCTDDIVLAYFNDGTVPEAGTWCEPDVEPEYYFGFGED